tara:strand:+ start:1755 stop:3059 length:1305 start_codon:yes stop_codon:yes gene_type:complete
MGRKYMGQENKYKQSQAGVIPDEWEVVELSSLTVMPIQNGLFNEPSRKGHGHKLINVVDLYSSVPICISNLERFGATKNEVSKFGVTYGDLFFTRSSLTPDGIAHCNIYGENHGEDIVFDCHIIRVRANDKKIDPFYLVRYCTSEPARTYLVANAKTTTMTTIDQGVIAKLPVPVPPLPEQRAIATALSDVDGLLGALDRLIAKKRDLKQAAMQQLLTGQTRLPGFHGEWEVKTFGEIFDYLPTATNSRSDLNDAGDTYYIHYGDIHTRFHNHLDFRTTQPPRINRSLCRNAALLKNGDWVMADASEDHDGVGKTIEVQGLEEDTKGIAGLHTFVLRERTPTYAPGFKGHLGNLKSLHEQYLRVATGMKVYGVSKTALKDLELPVPDPSEQTAIAEVLGEMDAELAGLEQRRKKTRALKQGMMQELLTGRTRLA